MSFDIALSGIQAINKQLETVSNNIANAATYGFKSGRANFASVMAGSKANGTEIGSITQNIGQNGATTTTGRSLDAAIDGSGFFVTVNPQGTTTYTRVGIFSTDTAGTLIDSNGNKVQGYGPSKNGTLGAFGDITVPTGQIPAVETTKASYVGNMSSGWVKPAKALDTDDASTYNMVKQSIAYDSLGNQRTISQYFVAGAGNTVNVFYTVDGAPIKPNDDGSASVTPSTTLTFGTDGQLAGADADTPAVATGTVTVPGTKGSADATIKIDYTGTTRFAGEATVTTNRSDGYASGAFVGVELSGNGSLIAKYSNDQSQTVGTVAVATFANEGALTAVSDTSWTANADSGTPLINNPGVGNAGKLNTGALEGSNVDITSELVGLMTSQRNYQANSKVLTTESAMMQALMQAM